MLSRFANVFTCLLIAASRVEGQLPPVPLGTVQVRLETFATGLPVAGSFNSGGPTDLVQMPNGTDRIIVTNFGGQIHLFDSNGNEASELFLDLANPVSPTYNADFAVLEANGLVSIAFHSDFSSPGAAGYAKFYTLEAENPGTGIPDFDGSIIPSHFLPHRQALYEYSLESHLDTMCNAACASSKREIFRVAQPGWHHHNLGDLEFDEEGLLYISSGDGSTSGAGSTQMSDNSQLLSNIFGKILRIDPLGNNSTNGHYGIPATNPLVGKKAKEEIYAYGLRNPYRISRDPITGGLFASDTGETSIESVDRIVAGGNHGWNLKEGSFLYDKVTKLVSEDVDTNGNGVGDFAESMNLVEPIFEYDRDDGRAVIGGTIYRGAEILGLDGQYIFADFSGPTRLFYGDPVTGEMFEFIVDVGGESLPNQIWSVNRDEAGEIYLLGRRQENEETVGYIARLVPAIDGDFDNDGNFDCADVDPLVAEIASVTHDAAFDLTNDGFVNSDDLDQWRIQAGLENMDATEGNAFLRGDANLDGTVDGQDFLLWNSHKFTSTAAWCGGDFNADGVVDGQDFVIWNEHKFTSSGSANAIPEPGAATLAVLVMVVVRARHVRR